MRTQRSLRPCSALFLALLPSCAASPAKTGVPDARAVVDRFAAVTGLAQNLQRTSTRRERGTVSFGGMEGKIDSVSAKPGRQKVALELGGIGTMLSGCDGQVAWISGQLTGSRLLTGMDSYQACLESAWDAALKPAARFESMQNTGRATFEGKECWRLELVARVPAQMDAKETLTARTTHEYYEIASGLLVGVEATMDGEFGSGPSTTLYSDYKDFGGVTLAARKVSRAQGVEMVFTTESIEFDTAAPADLEPPLEVARLMESR